MKITIQSPTTTLNYAKNELSSYLLRLSLSSCEVGKIEIHIKTDNAIAPVKDSLLDDAFKIDIANGKGEIIGNNERSSLLAVYHFLYRIGFRFLTPVKESEIIPDIISLQELTLTESHIYPFRHRGICIEGASSLENILATVEWMPKLGYNCFFSQFKLPFTFMERWYKHQNNPHLKPEEFGLDTAAKYTEKIFKEIKKRDMLLHTVGHGWTANAIGLPALGWDTQSTDGEADSSFFAMINGKRELFHGIPTNTNLCYSNEKVIDKLADLVLDYAINNKEADYVHFWLADAFNNVCECENCEKESLSDQYVTILNRIDEKLSENDLTTHIVFLLYQELLWPPIREKLRNPNRFTLMFAPISRTFEESYPEDTENKAIPEFKKNHISLPVNIEENLNFLFAWQKKFNEDSFVYDYPLGRAHYGDFGYYHISKILFNDIMKLPALGLNGYISCQELRCFSPNSLPNYVMGCALSGLCNDFEAFVTDYYRDFYGAFYEEAMAYLKELSSLSHPDYFNNKGDRVSKSINADFICILEVLNGFLPTFDKVKSSGGFTVHWELLEFHNSYLNRLVKALIKLSSGDFNRANELFKDFAGYIQENELKFQPYLDVYRLMDISTNYTGFKSI